MNRHKFNTSTVTDPSKLIRRTARVLGAVALLCILGLATVFAGVPAGYSEFLVPFDEDVFVYVTDPLVAATVDPIPGAYTTHSIISLTAWSDTITVYVDHWENGYGYNENAPDGAGSDEKYTMNLGDTYNFESAAIPRPRTMADGNTYVGAAGDCLGQPAPTGSTIVFRRTTNYCYDGRDRIVSIGGATTMTRGGWINSPFPSPQLGVRASVGEEVYPLAPQLVKYVLPFGEGTGGTSYERVIITIQATEDNTILQIDLDGNGVFDSFNPADGYRTARTNCAPGCLVPTITLNRGETYVLDRLSDGLTASGLVNKDAVILGSATLQVEYFYGEDNAGLYDTRAVSAYPRGFWGKEYYGPVNSAPDGGFGASSTDVLLYNPNAQTITITWETTTGTGTFTLASEETGFFQAKSGAYVPTGSGVYFRGTDSFWGISDFNTNSGNWDWGYTLVPGYLMTDDQTVAWAPGNVPLLACNATGGRGGGLFLTASQDNTTFFIDKNGDNVPDTDASIEVLRGTTVVAATNGGYRANRLESLYVTGSNVGTTAGSLCDLTGAHVFATGPFAMAYGENSTRVDATAGTDLGYTALPSPGNWMDLVLTVDKATSPVILSTVAGATTVTFTLVVNSELFDVNTLNVVDTLPANWEYIDNSTTITYPNLTQISGNPADPTVALPTLTWPTGLLGSLLPNQQIIITFQARTTAAFASGALSRNQVEATGTRTVGGVTQTFKARDFVFNTYLATTTNMQITKASSVAEATPLSPGDTFTYTVTSTNPSGTTQVLTGVAQNDVLPPGVTSVAGTTTLSHSSVADSFDSNAYNLNNGTRNWTGNWTETGDDASPTGDDLTGWSAAS